MKYNFVIVKDIISKEKALKLAIHLDTRKDKYSIYDDMVPDSTAFHNDDEITKLQNELRSTIEKHVDLKLFNTYNYCRIYQTGNTLDVHKDRDACEISVTLDLGGDKWSIFMGGEEVMLDIGDAVIYKGCDIPHWREEFKGDTHTQAFIHYVDQNGKRSWAKDDNRE